MQTALLFLFLVMSAAVSAQAIDVAKQRITLTLDAEPPSLNTFTSSDAISSEILVHVMEGLVQYGPDGKIMPAVAARWSSDNQGARFWLRKDARWSDGKPVTAHDFVFAWQQVVAPATASQYAFIFNPVKNAAAITRGELPVSALGVRAVNDYELEVLFERPCPYFVSLTAWVSYYPARRDIVAKWGRAYAADHDKAVYNGPFTLARWVHGAEILMRRNPQYWNNAATRLNEIHYAYVTKDELAKFNLFKNENTAYTTLSLGSLDSAMQAGYRVEQFQTAALFFLEFNHRPAHVTANLALRKAIQAVYDPDMVVYKMMGRPGTLPGRSLFPMTVRGHKGRFRDEYPARRLKPDLATAQRWLAQAKQELGVDQLPPLTLLASDSPLSIEQAEYLQFLLNKTLGISVQIDVQTFKQFIAKRGKGEFEISVAGWGPDYDDAMTFADLFASWNANNRGRYNNPAYDALIEQAGNSADPAVRFAAFAAMQQLIQDDVVILPIYEEVDLYLRHPALKGLYRPVFGGDLNLRFAWLEHSE